MQRRGLHRPRLAFQRDVGFTLPAAYDFADQATSESQHFSKDSKPLHSQSRKQTRGTMLRSRIASLGGASATSISIVATVVLRVLVSPVVRWFGRLTVSRLLPTHFIAPVHHAATAFGVPAV